MADPAPSGLLGRRCGHGARRAAAVGAVFPVLIALVLFLAPSASASIGDEQALAARYAPVVRLVEQTEPCGPGEPFVPMDVSVLFDQPTVALRGPWLPTDLVAIGPSATDLVGRWEYHLDFPGNPLDAGCDYEFWQQRIMAGASPVVYAHVATDPGYPGQVALQYWFFYAFNDFNNKHEGDWEMIQLDFDAPDARTALSAPPTEVGYSSHEGAERSAWGDQKDQKLELVDGTHPVVYVSRGSHAGKYTAALYVGSTADAGVGCDDTNGPHVQLAPTVVTIPTDPAAARAEFPWIAYEGHWGELRPAFYNGPTGPNTKEQWTAPIDWAEHHWRSTSYAVPAGGLIGTGATDFFCSAVAGGSTALLKLVASPAPTLIFLVVLVVLLVYLAARVTWTPVAPLRVARRRAWGQIVSASGRMYVGHPLLFLGIGVLLIPLALATAGLQWLLYWGVDLVGSVTGDVAGVLALVVVLIGTTLTFFGLAVMQAATARALVELDEGRSPSALDAYRLVLGRGRSLLRTNATGVAIITLLTLTAFLIPVAIWLAVRWSLLAAVVEIEGGSGFRGLRRSAELVRGRWLRVGSLVGLSAGLSLLAGPLLGALLIFGTSAPLPLLNVVAGVFYVLALPFVALVSAYVYFDVRVREEVDPVVRKRVLPDEVALRDLLS